MSATLQIAERDAAVADAGDDGAGLESGASTRKAGPFGGLDAREAAARAHASRREKRTEREAAAELDRLSVLARAGVVAARVLTYSEQVALLRAMLEKAKQGHVQHGRFVLDWLVKLGPSDPGDEDVNNVLDPADMSPAQRAAVRAALLQSLATPHAEGTEDSETPA